jgi:chromatin assembly factor 1 subunit B
MFNLDYRMVYAVASQDSVYIYDTQQARPLCAISGMHFAPITDLAWSHDGSILMFASADGYCSAVVFGENELGKKYTKKVVQQQDDMMDIVDDNKLQQVLSDTSTPAETKAVSTPTSSSPSPTIDEGNLLKKRLPNNNIQNASDKPKKRRITPILVSSNI